MLQIQSLLSPNDLPYQPFLCVKSIFEYGLVKH
jgi:hypothetical protein